jgi:hypothetical protein
LLWTIQARAHLKSAFHEPNETPPGAPLIITGLFQKHCNRYTTPFFLKLNGVSSAKIRDGLSVAVTKAIDERISVAEEDFVAVSFFLPLSPFSS